jgi:hypothetical protein
MMNYVRYIPKENERVLPYISELCGHQLDLHV